MVVSSAIASVALVSSTTAVRAVLLAGAFVLLLFGAELFTNGVEWLGYRLGLGSSATGSILAAVGTALPETMIPVIAIVSAHLAHDTSGRAESIGVGAILGAPFLLATIATFLIGVSVWWFRDRRDHGDRFVINRAATSRDLRFFLLGYGLAVLAAFVHVPLMADAIAVVLVGLYGVYLYRSLAADEFVEEESDLDELLVGRLIDARSETDSNHGADPGLGIVALQTAIALAFIIGGADLFVSEIEFFSTQVLHIPGAVLSLLLAPLATELPEKFNSILWISQDKDTLALGNITGAMAFQGTLPVTLGILFTPWDLSIRWGTTGFLNATSAVLAIVSGLVLYLRVRKLSGARMRPAPFLIGGGFYLLFIAITLYHVLVLGVATVPGH